MTSPEDDWGSIIVAKSLENTGTMCIYIYCHAVQELAESSHFISFLRFSCTLINHTMASEMRSSVLFLKRRDLILIAKTGLGKSMIPQVVTVLLRKSISLVI